MKILVCLSKAPDTTSKVAFTDNDSKFLEDKVTWIVNPYDEWYSLVRALELKETLGGTVTTISVGGADYEPIIRKAFAIGADDGVRIDLVANDASVVAAQIAAYAQDKGFDLILCGKETIDYNGSQVGSLLSAALDLPYISLATKLTINGTLAEVDREIEGGKEICEVSLPALISCQKGMAEARIPNMKGIMAARTKPLQVVAPVESTSLTEVVKFELPAAKKGCHYLTADQMDELVRLLHEEAKVI
jgi:electron transfer flavoprotein beta subunit